MKSPPGRKFFFIVMAVVMAIGFVGLSIPTAQSADLVGLVSAVNVTTIDNTMSYVDADSIAAVTAGGSVFRNARMAANITAESVIDIFSDAVNNNPELIRRC